MKKIHLSIIVLLIVLNSNAQAQWDYGTSGTIKTTDNVEIKGSTDAGLLTVIENNATSRRRINIGATNTEVYIQHLYGTSGVPFNFKVSGTNVMTFNGLNVGIGTDSPQAKLDLSQGNINLDNGFGLNSDGGASIFTGAGGQTFSIKAGGSAGHIANFMNTNGDIKIAFKNDGKVGIGTESPKNLLEIGKGYSFHDGGHKVLGFGYAPGAQNTSLLNGFVGEIRFDPIGGRLRFGLSNQSYTTDQTSLSLITAMTINNNGSVGIGTMSTGPHKLAVEGSIAAREIKVIASGWSDFVFEKGYKLRTLEEIENYINEKGHLPEIPSEAEVIENGIHLGEMNAKLLQKIEELTLYLIEEHKSKEKLQEQVELLKREVAALSKEK